MFQASFFPQTGLLILHPPELPVRSDDIFEHDLLFVWDDLMSPHQAREIVGRFVPFAPAVIGGLARITDRLRETYSFEIERQEESILQGAVLIGITAGEMDAIDRFERCPIHMVRKKVEVRIGDVPRIAQMYFPTEW